MIHGDFMKILVVDDDPLAADMVATIVEMSGFAAEIATNALDAIETINAGVNIGLILSDMNMPLVNGLEFYQELRAQNNNTPFVLLTGDDPQAYIDQHPGLDACLTKDFSLSNSLPDLINKILPGVN